MAQARFFKKASPNDAVTLANGQKLQFKTADYRWGFFSTDNQDLAGQLVSLVERGQFGLSEVSWDEYNNDFLKKKTNQPLKPRWREEVTNSGIKTNPFQDLFQEKNVVEVKADRKPMPVAMEELPPELAPKSASTVTEPSEFQANLGKRTQ